MKRVHLAALVLFAAACSEATGHLPIEGGLTVELSPLAEEAGVKPEVTVYLGDGATFLQHPDEGGKVAFSDPSLKGPQDIHVVWAYPQADGKYSTNVYTALEVNRREVYLDLDSAYGVSANQGSSTEKYGTVTVRVTGLADESDARVHVTAYEGERQLGFAKVLSEGTAFPGGEVEISVDLVEKPSGKISLVAFHSDSELKAVRQAGRVADVSLDQRGNGRADIGVKPVVVEDVTLTVSGLRESVRGSVAVGPKNVGLIGSAATGLPPVVVSAVKLEGDWAGFSRTACVQLHTSSGSSVASDTFGSETRKGLALLEVPTLVKPSLSQESPGVVLPPEEPLVLEWRADPTASGVQIRVEPIDATVRWSIEAPASRTTFQPQAFPEALAHLSSDLRGSFELTVSSTGSPQIADYQGRFVKRPRLGINCDTADGEGKSFSATYGYFLR